MITLFLCGDVMTGRGIDQILACPSAPDLHEPYARDAREYVALAEAVSGPIPRSVGPAYPWGDALAELERAAPDVRLVNLETSVTRCDAWEDKGINYRMHPDNVACLSAAGIDVCALANNHTLDYGTIGLAETLETLAAVGLKTAGAGRNLEEARRPGIVPLAGRQRVLVFATATESSGIPVTWAATRDSPGVDMLPDLSDATADEIAHRAQRGRQVGDIVILSIHWGSNWGYEVAPAQIRFAHRLIDAGIDLVHGHSSHHPRPIEVYRRKLVLYGCGDFINDYEGIRGYEAFRGDLVLMYFATLDERGGLVGLRMTPLRLRNLRLNTAEQSEAEAIRATLERISADFGSRVVMRADGRLELD